MQYAPTRGTARHTLTVIAFAALSLTATACGPAAPAGPAADDTPTTAASPSTTTSDTPTTSPTETPTTSTPAPQTPKPTKEPAAKPTVTDEPSEPKVQPVVVVLRPGDAGAKVRSMQARLKQIGWFSGDVTNFYGTRTTTAISGFQRKRGFPVTGIADQRTYDRLLSMTRTPTQDELNNVKPQSAPAAKPGSWDVDQRCLTGRVICISKSTRSLTWVIDGKAQYSFDVRFGSEAEPTREGTFSITWKKVDVISNLYGTAMPYSMFFSGGQAIHYSADFAANGYNGSSHGCVNVRNMTLLKQLYNTAPVGTKVVVHW
ncbi:L,D-transpeptidase family protein [Intrasporangium calvum]|uniref:L,D-transpeptidase family protein n=1 Tax=Intrasporangium calvum TaxID=53358 RepID=A0ABT5GGJ7_9MICO|nr:L,D-transpeptidase family protein [Intrasporangium calvum]MDC5697218.1 L,D-transpeptidase family protein [Intrasporangium calvum]